MRSLQNGAWRPSWLAEARRTEPGLRASHWLRPLIAVGILFATTCAWAQEQSAEPALRKARVGVVLDGASAFYEDLGTAFRKETQELNGDEFEIIIDREKSVVCKFDHKCIHDGIIALLRDKDIDLVVGQGFIASSELLKEKRLSKPALAPFVIDPQAQGLAVEEGRKNLGFTLWSADLVSDMRAASGVLAFKTVTLFVDGRTFAELPEAVVAHFQKQAAQVGKQLTVVTLDGQKELAEQLPAQLEFAYVGPLVSFSKEKRQELTRLFAERKVPSFSWLGRKGVEAGFLIGSSSAYDEQRLARLVALNVQALLHGEKPQPVLTNSVKRHLIINGPLFRQLGLPSNTQTLLEAEIVGADAKMSSTPKPSADIFTLREAVSWALAHNVEIESADYQLQYTEQDANRARSPLLPQVGLGAGIRVIDGDRALPNNRQYQANWSAQAHQTLYDERAWGGLTSGKHLTRASQQERESVRLNVIYQVSAAYIDYLRASTSIDVQRRDLELSRENLDMARVRQRVGQAGMEEVYRWESRIAQSRRQLVSAQAQVQAARVKLNTALNRPAETPFQPEALEVSSEQLLSSHQPVVASLGDHKRLESLMQFMVSEGISRSPDLQGADAKIAAADRQVSAQKRSYFLPTVGVDASVQHRFWAAGDGVIVSPITALSPNRFDWQVGLSAELPLFEGALKSAEIGKSHAQRGQLSAAKKNIALLVEQDVRAALYQAAASHVSISITEDALRAAQGNLKIVRDKYQRGLATILELLDAQNQSLSAENEAIIAKYTFLQDLMGVERAIARFDFEASPTEQNEFVRRLVEYQNSLNDPSSDPAASSAQ